MILYVVDAGVAKVSALAVDGPIWRTAERAPSHEGYAGGVDPTEPAPGSRVDREGA